MPFEEGSGFRCPCGFYAHNEETLMEHAPRCRPNRRLLLYKPDRTFHTREDFVERRKKVIRKYTGSVDDHGIPALDSPPFSDEETTPRRCRLSYTLHEGKTDSDTDRDRSPLSSDTEPEHMFLEDPILPRVPEMDTAASSSWMGQAGCESNGPLFCIASGPSILGYAEEDALCIVERRDLDRSMPSCSFNQPVERVQAGSGRGNNEPGGSVVRDQVDSDCDDNELKKPMVLDRTSSDLVSNEPK